VLDPAVRAGFRRRAITAAMAELCVEQGYLGTSVADVAARARMSRATVYGLFANREQIFLTLLDHGAAEVLRLAEGSCRRAGPDPRARIEAGLGAILGWVAEHPTEAYAFLVEGQVATPEALRHYHAAIAGLAGLLSTAVPVAEVGSVRLEEIIVGELASVLAGLARQSRLEEVPAVLEDFVGLVTAPYFPTGAEADLT
jgi:AcrR family transcriptional regulator